MTEQHYAFIKDGRVANIVVFAFQNEELADNIAKEQGYDDAVWVGENPPARFSRYDGKDFFQPTHLELVELGILDASAIQSLEEEITENIE
jgi:hypothetical protein